MAALTGPEATDDEDVDGRTLSLPFLPWLFRELVSVLPSVVDVVGSVVVVTPGGSVVGGIVVATGSVVVVVSSGCVVVVVSAGPSVVVVVSGGDGPVPSAGGRSHRLRQVVGVDGAVGGGAPPDEGELHPGASGKQPGVAAVDAPEDGDVVLVALLPVDRGRGSRPRGSRPRRSRPRPPQAPWRPNCRHTRCRGRSRTGRSRCSARPSARRCRRAALRSGCGSSRWRRGPSRS